MLSLTEPCSQARLGDAVKFYLNNRRMASELWQRLRALRKHTGLSGELFGAEVGVSKAAVSQWESPDPKKRTSPDLQKVIDMARLFEVPLDWLLDDRSEVDREWWVDPDTPPTQPPQISLADALEVLGIELAREMPQDVREDVADALHKLALRRGAERDQQQVISLLASPGKRQIAA